MSDPVLMPAPDAVAVLPQGATLTGQLITELAEMQPLTGEEKLVGVQEAGGLKLGRALSVSLLRQDVARIASEAIEQTVVTEAGRVASETTGAALGGVRDDIAELQAWRRQQDYVPPVVSALTVSPAAAEVGTTVTSVVLTATRTRLDLPVQISGAGTGTIPAGQNSVTLAGNWSAEGVFTATITDPAPPPGQSAGGSRLVSLPFRFRSYRGASPVETPDDAVLRGFSDQPLAASYAARASVIACGPAGGFPTLAFPRSWGPAPATIQAYGLPFNAFRTLQRDVVNASGAAVPCWVLVFNTRQFGDVPVTW